MKSSSLRVCLLSSSYPRFTGDYPGVFVHHLGTHLHKLGVQVYALVPDDYGSPKHEVMNGVNIIRFPYFVPRKFQKLCYGQGVSTNLQNSFLAKIQLPFFSVAQLIWLFWYCQRLEIDIINTHWVLPQGLNAAVLRKLLGIPHVSTVHAAGVFALHRLSIGSAIARFISNNTDYSYAVSSYVKQSLVELAEYHKPIEVLPMGIETDFFRHSHNVSKEVDLLFAGRLVEKKGLKYLIDSVYQLIGDFPNIKLVIVGDGFLKERLEQKVKEKGLEGNISFWGRVKNSQMPEIYAKSRIVVVPSIIDSKGETEGMPVVILEALASGNIVVASDVSGIPDVIKDAENGFLVRPGSVTSLVKGIRKGFAANEEEMAALSKKTAQTYDWAVIAKKYLETFHRVSRNP